MCSADQPVNQLERSFCSNDRSTGLFNGKPCPRPQLGEQKPLSTKRLQLFSAARCPSFELTKGDMTNKIIHFPSTLGRNGIEPVGRYSASSRAELLIVIWLSGWAILAAAECIRQMSFLAI
jgi:hypothetical protein